MRIYQTMSLTSVRALPMECREMILEFRSGVPLNHKDNERKKIVTQRLAKVVKKIEHAFAKNPTRFFYRSARKKLEKREIAALLVNTQAMLSTMCWGQCVNISCTHIRRCAQLLSLSGLLVTHQRIAWWKNRITLRKAKTIFWSTVSLSAIVNIATCLHVIRTFWRTPDRKLWKNLFRPLLTSKMTVYHQSFSVLYVFVWYRALKRYVQEVTDILNHRL